MLVQPRTDGRIRLIRQHDHALLAGTLACAWRGLGREAAPLPFDVVLAVGLHDLAWRSLDREPRLDLATGLPFPFHDHPLEEKLAAYGDGLDQVQDIHPYAALLGSLHYTSFPDIRGRVAFQEKERRRRAYLTERLELEAEDRVRVETDLAFLQLFDNLSLFLCLTPPGADTEGYPTWVEDCRHLETPGGATFHLTWLDDEVLHADPFPFRDTVEVRVPHRELPAAGYRDVERLAADWRDAPERQWWITVRPAPRLA